MSDSDMANLRYQLSAVIKERQCTNVSTQRIRKKLNNGLRVKLDIHGTQLHFITKIETISKPPKLCHKAIRATNTPRKATKPLIRPPHPTRPGFPTAAPSVFRHAHSAWGLSHLTCTNLLLPDFLAFKPQCWNSKARKRAYLWTYGWACRFLKIAKFLCFHNSQMVKGKMILQGGCTPNLQMLLLQLFFSHSTRFLS